MGAFICSFIYCYFFFFFVERERKKRRGNGAVVGAGSEHLTRHKIPPSPFFFLFFCLSKN